MQPLRMTVMMRCHRLTWLCIRAGDDCHCTVLERRHEPRRRKQPYRKQQPEQRCKARSDESRSGPHRKHRLGIALAYSRVSS